MYIVIFTDYCLRGEVSHKTPKNWSVGIGSNLAENENEMLGRVEAMRYMLNLKSNFFKLSNLLECIEIFCK